MYDPKIGRFLGEDPIGMADDHNLYRYVGNSPTNATDPSGLQKQSVRDILGMNKPKYRIPVTRDNNIVHPGGPARELVGKQTKVDPRDARYQYADAATVNSLKKAITRSYQRGRLRPVYFKTIENDQRTFLWNPKRDEWDEVTGLLSVTVGADSRLQGPNVFRHRARLRQYIRTPEQWAQFMEGIGVGFGKQLWDDVTSIPSIVIDALKKGADGIEFIFNVWKAGLSGNEAELEVYREEFRGGFANFFQRFEDALYELDQLGVELQYMKAYEVGQLIGRFLATAGGTELVGRAVLAAALGSGLGIYLKGNNAADWLRQGERLADLAPDELNDIRNSLRRDGFSETDINRIEERITDLNKRHQEKPNQNRGQEVLDILADEYNSAPHRKPRLQRHSTGNEIAEDLGMGAINKHGDPENWKYQWTARVPATEKGAVPGDFRVYERWIDERGKEIEWHYTVRADGSVSVGKLSPPTTAKPR